MEMGMKQWWNDDWQKEPKYVEKKLPQYHFVHQKSHMDCPGTEPRLPCWEAGNYLPELWYHLTGPESLSE
jgi:hypothetical protein